MDEFYDWSVEKGNYEQKWDVEDLYGEDWWKENKDTIYDNIDLDSCMDVAWSQWIENWPGYEETLVQVREQIGNLESIKGSQDINQVMSAISLALNTAHNSGLMFEHIDLSEEEMNQLSNIDTSEWENQMKRFSKLWKS